MISTKFTKRTDTHGNLLGVDFNKIYCKYIFDVL